jgi:GDPmannose 4,6-dehydratase
MQLIAKDKNCVNALIFGANGQDGYYLREKCLQRGIEPVSVSRRGDGIRADVSSFDQVQELVQKLQPTYIFHLAANSTTKHDALFENHQTIATGTLNILEAVRRFSPQSKIFITGSGLQFENNGQPIIETDSFVASSAYCVARMQSVYAARYYRSLGLAVYIGYLFHHESPLRGASHVSQVIVSLVKQIAAGQTGRITLGDIQVKKEWTFAGDIAEAIMILLEQDQIFETVIGSGKAYSIQEWLELCFRAIGKNWQDHVSLNSDFTPEYKLLVSNPKTITSLGWCPSVSLEELSQMMLSH